MGYISAERAPRIGQLMHQHTITAIFQEATRYGAVIRVAFDDDVPVLPPSKPRAPAEPDFYPDEIWPDD